LGAIIQPASAIFKYVRVKSQQAIRALNLQFVSLCYNISYCFGDTHHSLVLLCCLSLNQKLSGNKLATSFILTTTLVGKENVNKNVTPWREHYECATSIKTSDAKRKEDPLTGPEKVT
jgi:hypothetical protein